MQLKSLMVSGFKSFHEARLDFPQGITAVVGPNGAGKSNVVDAMLWVLGEQSTKALRSERMEDVIFNGTEARKPLGMAEVSLVVTDVTSQELESISGIFEELPGNKELMVTRRLYRDGDSEYFINKIPCRLKDVRLLFLEARAGTKGHTVIEQGNIDQILSGSSQDRRNFIEETAGIGRFKKQKTEALRKLNSTQQNLVRVRDVIGEVQKQLRTLERQAKQAEQYGNLQEECRTLEIKILSGDYHELTRDHEDIEGRITTYETQEAEHMAEESRVATTHEQRKEEQLQIGEVVGKTQEELRKLEHDMGQTLTTLEVERNRIQLYSEQRAQGMEEQHRLHQESKETVGVIASLQSRLVQAMEEAQQAEQTVSRLETEEQSLLASRSSVQTQTESLRQKKLEGTAVRAQMESRIQSVEARKDSLNHHIEQLRDDQHQGETEHAEIVGRLADLREKFEVEKRQLQTTRTKRQDVVAQLADLNQHIQEVEQQRLEGRTERAAVESRLSALQAVIQEEFGYHRGSEGQGSSIRQVCQGVKEAVGERLEVPQHLEQAIEAALGEYLRAWVVEGDGAIVQALQYMKEHDQGRATFIPLQPYDGGEEQQPPFWWPELKQHDGVIGRAIELIGLPEELKPVLCCLLQRVVVMQDLHQAMALVRERRWNGPSAPIFATLSGEIVETSGLVGGGSPGSSSGVLQRRREVRTLEKHVEDILQGLEHAENRYGELQQQHGSAKEQLGNLDESLKESERIVLITEHDIRHAEQELSDSEDHMQSVTQELQASQEEDVRLEGESRTCRERLVQLSQDQHEQDRDLAQFLAQLQDIEAETARLYEQLTAARLTMTTLHERRERIEADLVRTKEEEAARQSRLRLLAEQVQSLELKERESQAEHARADVLFKELEHRKDEQQQHLQSLEERHHEGMRRVRELEQHLAEIRKQYTTVRDARAETEVQLAEVRTRLQTVIDTLTGTYGQVIEDLSSPSAGEENSEGEEGQEVWRERVRTIRTRLEKMGPLNLAAIEEHRELEERYHFLTKQEADLTESIQSLQEIIDRLSQTTNQMFEETFKAVQEKFGEVFSALFAGGHAELVLTRPETDGEGGDSYLDPGVDIVAQPPGKRLKNLSMLSGGEKALTVLALLFASFLIKPSPFCILDEVDAPLDEPNVIRFARFLTQLTNLSQFLVITHNKRTMEIADSLFGVTMEEPGVSKFVSVRVSDLQQV